MLLPARTGHAIDGRRSPLRGASTATWLLLAITALAAALRFTNLAQQSYWLDESQAVHELGLPFGQMLHAWSGFEWNPPLYLIIAWPWTKLFGTGEVGLRSLSALLGTGLIPLVYLCGRELISERAGLLAAAFTAVNPFMIWYSQEAREYMLLVVLCAASLLFFVRAWRTGARRDLIWWAVFSALALLTQYFAGFLIAAEGLALVLHLRSRSSLIALLSMGALELVLIPHVVPRLNSPAQFIVSVPLSVRLQQVPVTFAMNTLYESGIVSWGLIGAAVVGGAMIAQLVVGADEPELRGAGVAAALAAVVLLVPLALALAGHDDYIARGLMPGWVPLVIALAAACTAQRAQRTGALLAAVMLGLFVYAGVRIQSDAQFQKTNWRAIAAALGSPHGTRAIVSYDGRFAAGPLSVYLPGVPWSGPGLRPLSPAPVSVSELDIVGSADDAIARLPPNVRLLSSRIIGGYRLLRLELSESWTLSPPLLIARAASILPPAPPAPEVLIQHDGHPNAVGRRTLAGRRSAL